MNWFDTVAWTVGKCIILEKEADMTLDHVKEVVAKAVIRFGNRITSSPRDSKPVTDDMFLVKGLEISVSGVTFNDRQAIINSLTCNETVKLVHMPSFKYPNRIAVLVDGLEVGYVPDNPTNSISRWLLDEQEYGYSWAVISFRKVGGLYSNSRLGLRLKIRMVKPCETI